MGVCLAAGAPLVRRAPPRLRLPVTVYALAVSSMAALACMSGSPRLAAGGVLFLLSDVFVALYRFTTPRLRWKLFGVPLYYAAQLVFAASAG
jgi:uncharacterized membrane protein YhhN